MSDSGLLETSGADLPAPLLLISSLILFFYIPVAGVEKGGAEYLSYIPDTSFTLAVQIYGPLNADDSAHIEIIQAEAVSVLAPLLPSSLKIQDRKETRMSMEEYGSSLGVTVEDSLRAVYTGHLLGAHFLLTGTFIDTGGIINLQLELYSISNGEIISSIQFREPAVFSKFIKIKYPVLLRELIGPLEKYTVPVIHRESSGSVSLSLFPATAKLFADNKYFGTGSGIYHLDTGEILITVFAPGYKTKQELITVGGADTVSVSIELEYLFSALEIFSSPKGASLKLNSIKLGSTPFKNLRFPAGEYALDLFSDGYKDYHYEFNLKPREYARITVPLKVSEAISDSLSRLSWRKNRFQKGRRVIFSLLSAASLVSSGVCYVETKRKIADIAKIESEYDSAKGGFSEIKSRYYNLRTEADAAQIGVNISLVAGGLFFSLFTVSLFF